jgi:hypothetical protein
MRFQHINILNMFFELGEAHLIVYMTIYSSPHRLRVKHKAITWNKAQMNDLPNTSFPMQPNTRAKLLCVLARDLAM